jgi:hypothetical protein
LNANKLLIKKVLETSINDQKSVTVWNRPWKNPLSPNGTTTNPTRLAMFLGGMSLGPFHCT